MDNRKAAIAVAVLLAVLAATIGGYVYWRSHRPAAAPPVPAQAPPPLPPPVSQVLESPPQPQPLPALSASDAFILDALSGLIGEPSLIRLFRPERLVVNIVATVDNLPRRRAPMQVMPVRPAPGEFMVLRGPGEALSISPRNAARYAAYLKLAGTVDAGKLVALYIRLYPLFQQAYVELGYPQGYFNDRLIETLDDLLAAPDVREPVGLAWPGVYYRYADPDLEGRSIGQRILMRMGSAGEGQAKAALRAIRQELARHMHARRIDGEAGPA